MSWRPSPYGVIPLCDATWFVPIWKNTSINGLLAFDFTSFLQKHMIICDFMQLLVKQNTCLFCVWTCILYLEKSHALLLISPAIGEITKAKIRIISIQLRFIESRTKQNGIKTVRTTHGFTQWTSYYLTLHCIATSKARHTEAIPATPKFHLLVFNVSSIWLGCNFRLRAAAEVLFLIYAIMDNGGGSCALL